MSKRRQWILAVIISSVLLALCIGFLIAFSTTDIEDEEPLEVDKVSCIVLDSYIGESGYFSMCWIIDVFYTVDEKNYTDEIVDKCIIGTPEYEQEVDEIQREYPVDSVQTCYYSNGDPNDVEFDKPYDGSAMAKFMKWLMVIFFLILMIFLTIGSSLALYGEWTTKEKDSKGDIPMVSHGNLKV